MSRREPLVSVHQMRDYAREALEMVRERSRTDLDTDRMLNLALVRLLEVIGEAATRIPEDFRSQHPQVHWSQIVGLRNRLIHGYDAVDFDVVWQIVRDELPVLIVDLEAIINGDP